MLTTCRNSFVSVRQKEATVLVSDKDGKEHTLAEIFSIGPQVGVVWDWSSFDDGCLCFCCIRMHDTFASISAFTGYNGYNPARIRHLNLLGWTGKDASWVMADGWPKPVVAGVCYPNGLVCSRCNGRNEYAGAEHLKEGKYVCYNCK